MSEISEIIERMAKSGKQMQVSVGKVKSVDENAMTCDIDMETSPVIPDVRLRSVIDNNDKGILIYPKVGSYVLVGLINDKKETAYICGYSEVEKVRVICDNIELGGDDYSIVKAEILKDIMTTNKQFIDAITNVINSPTPITEPGNGAPSALQIALQGAIAYLEFKDGTGIENKNVKHG